MEVAAGVGVGMGVGVIAAQSIAQVSAFSPKAVSQIPLPQVVSTCSVAGTVLLSSAKEWKTGKIKIKKIEIAKNFFMRR
jgi:hypothetical protein